MSNPKMLSSLLSLLICPLILGASGCDKPPEPPPGQPAPKPLRASETSGPTIKTPPAGATKRASAKPANITWQKPAAWKTVDHPSRMRKATYEIPGVDGAAAATLSVTRVGGSVQANIARWEGQFDGSPKGTRTERKANGVRIHIVQIDGTFKGGGMPGAPVAEKQPAWSMLSAIAEADGANYFFKMTGPKKTVDAARGDFDVLLGSFTPGG
jgi:hypothetical protein